LRGKRTYHGKNTFSKVKHDSKGILKPRNWVLTDKTINGLIKHKIIVKVRALEAS